MNINSKSRLFAYTAATKQHLRQLVLAFQPFLGTDVIYLVKGGSWLSVGQIATSILSLLWAISFANFVPIEVYGNYKYIMAVFAVFSLFTLTGMNNAVTQAAARGYEGSLFPALATKIRWGLLGLAASLLMSGYYFAVKNPTLGLAFLMAATFLPVMGSITIYNSLLHGRKDFRRSSQYGVFCQFITTALLVSTLFLTDNLLLILLVYFLSKTLLHTLIFILILKKMPPNQNQDPRTIPYGKHLSVSALLPNVTGTLDQILIWHFLGASQLAVYALALAPIQLCRAMLKTFSILALPKLSQRNIHELKERIPGQVRKGLLILIFPVCAYILLAPTLYTLIFPKYLSSVIFSQVAAVSLVFSPKFLYGQTLLAHRKTREIYKLRLIVQTGRAAILLTLIPTWGIWGAVTGVLVENVLSLVISKRLFHRL